MTNAMVISIFLCLLLTYVHGAKVQIEHFKLAKKFCVVDLILFLLSPFNVIPMVMIRLVSYVVDVDKVLFKSND